MPHHWGIAKLQPETMQAVAMLSFKSTFVKQELYILRKSWEELKSILLKIFFSLTKDSTSFFKWELPWCN